MKKRDSLVAVKVKSSAVQSLPVILSKRIAPIRTLSVDYNTIASLYEKFQSFSMTHESGLEVCMEKHFKLLIGNLGNFYIGTRIFDVVLQLSLKNERK